MIFDESKGLKSEGSPKSELCHADITINGILSYLFICAKTSVRLHSGVSVDRGDLQPLGRTSTLPVEHPELPE